MMKRLLLINPALYANGGRVPNVAGAASMEPLALAYVAALTPPGWKITIWDEVMEPMPNPTAADLVGISTITATAPRAYELASQFRHLGIPVVLGGPHPTMLPDEAARYADVVFSGEAEGAWPRLVEDFTSGHLKSRYEGGGPPLVHNLVPRRDLYQHRYVINLISASRGCHYRCEFCSIWKFDSGRLRLRQKEDVWAELESWQSGWATLFTDDNIMADREWSLALFRGMAERGLRRRFAVQASLSIADDDELLFWLQRAGCFAIMTGLESVNEESLRVMRKGVNLRIGPAAYQAKIAQIHAHRMMVAGTFMFGNDGDGLDIFDQTVSFVKEASVDLAHFGILVPDPGTDLHARLHAEGRLIFTSYPQDYRRHHLGQALFVPAKMTTRQLEDGMRRATHEIGCWPVAVQRAWRTWRHTHNFFAALIALVWTRSGLLARVSADYQAVT
ncbi:B12-binding domain-containing radical SAM protein [Candidatus Amarolinea aalborgensis]|uniref:B12-binding domain-containing radical SAM protein n=1 Tax=Candidatus Amarolinea aalborgensis TaxID=2249329 RepID=UPI003BFA23CA